MKKITILIAMVMFLTLTFNVSAEELRGPKEGSMEGLWSFEKTLFTFKDGKWFEGKWSGKYTFDGKRLQIFNEKNVVIIGGEVKIDEIKDGRPTVFVIEKGSGGKRGWHFTFLTDEFKITNLSGMWWWRTAPVSNSYFLVEFMPDGKRWFAGAGNTKGTYSYNEKKKYFKLTVLKYGRYDTYVEGKVDVRIDMGTGLPIIFVTNKEGKVDKFNCQRRGSY